MSFFDVEEHRARGIRIIRHMGPASGQVPDEPGVDRSEEQITLLRLAACAGHMIENPADFCSGEVGVDEKSCLFFYIFVETF